MTPQDNIRKVFQGGCLVGIWSSHMVVITWQCPIVQADPYQHVDLDTGVEKGGIERGMERRGEAKAKAFKVPMEKKPNAKGKQKQGTSYNTHSMFSHSSYRSFDTHC